MVWGHHIQLRSHPLLFHDFQCFNVKVAAAHHPVIQKEVDELLAKGATEPFLGGWFLLQCVCGTLAYWGPLANTQPEAF